MKKNIVFILAFFFSVVLVAAVPHQALASTNGWKSSGQNKYYYVNNKKIIGSKRLVSIITILTKREEWSKIKLSKSKIIAITINQMERKYSKKYSKTNRYKILLFQFQKSS